MKKVRIEDLRPGMKLARTVYSPEGLVLLREQAEITNHVIDKLKQLGLPAAYIATTAETEIQDPVSEATRVDLIRSLSKLDASIRAGRVLNLVISKRALYDLVDEIVSNQKNMVGITDIRMRNDYIYGHSVNVCVIAVKMGLELGYNQLKMADLAVGAVYHDIGMTKLPIEILDRVGGLTSEELKLVRTHPEEGFAMLRQNQDITVTSAHVAYQHHERYDGSGYPRGLAGDAIHEFGRITAVADVFDSLTSEKLYRKAKSLPEAVQLIQAKSGTEFDPHMVDILKKVVC